MANVQEEESYFWRRRTDKSTETREGTNVREYTREWVVKRELFGNPI